MSSIAVKHSHTFAFNEIRHFHLNFYANIFSPIKECSTAQHEKENRVNKVRDINLLRFYFSCEFSFLLTRIEEKKKRQIVSGASSSASQCTYLPPATNFIFLLVSERRQISDKTKFTNHLEFKKWQSIGLCLHQCAEKKNCHPFLSRYWLLQTNWLLLCQK